MEIHFAQDWTMYFEITSITQETKSTKENEITVQYMYQALIVGKYSRMNQQDKDGVNQTILCSNTTVGTLLSIGE